MSCRWLAIVNPHAGGIRHRYLDQDFLEELSSKVDAIVYTLNSNDALAIAARAGDYDGLVAVGGDGTVSEILTGMNRESQQLAVIPAGTGNCLAADLGLTAVKTALHALSHGRARQIDTMRALLIHSDGTTTTRDLASTAGMGYATDVAILAKQKFAYFRGLAYAAAAVFVRPRRRTIRIVVDDGEKATMQLTGLLINNTRYIGNVKPFPEAEINDGLLDFFLFRVGWFRQCLHDLEMATGLPVCGTPRSLRCKSLHLDFHPPETVMLDGELIEQVTSMDVACLPKSLTCVEPGEC